MAFSYIILGQKELGGAKKVYGTWNAASATEGTITWGGTVGTGGIPHEIISGKCVSSTSFTTMTAAKLCANGTMVLTCVSSDTGYWSVLLK